MFFFFFFANLKKTIIFAFLFAMVRTKKIISYLFVAIFLSYYAGISLFSHTHIISGVVIFHSHLHKDSHHDTKSGGHTENSIALIAQISNFEYIDFLYNCFIKPIQQPLYESNCVEKPQWIISIHLENLALRAPPVV